MDTIEPEKQLLLMNFFEIMGKTAGLRITAALLDQPATTRDLATRFNLKEAEVLEHLAALRHLKLVTVRVEDGRSTYAFDQKALIELNKTVLSRKPVPTPVDHLDPETRDALRPFFAGERIRDFPTNPKKFRMLIDWVITLFETGKRYTEKEVNEILLRYHEDYATLRRELVDLHLMERERGVYWRV